jgi:hypothetical protein
MNLKNVTFLLLSVLLFSAIFAATMILTQPHEIKSMTKTCQGDPIGGGHPSIWECQGDPIGGGHPSIGDQYL